MPELPEVETVCQTLKRQIVGKTIAKIDLYYKGIIVNPEALTTKLINQTLIDITRKGKYLIFLYNKGSVISHLRMEGKYFIKPSDAPIEKHEHVVFTFTDGITWRYHDTRKFGRMVYLDTNQMDEIVKYPSLAKLGPDANAEDVTPEYLYEELKKKQMPIKSSLLDQEVLAGLGNIYVDEVCFMVGINPIIPSNYLEIPKCKDILKASKDVLNRAIKKGGTTIRSYTSSLGVTGLFQLELLVHDKEGEPCPVCKTMIKKMTVGGRGTYYCPYCQKLPHLKIGITGGIATGKSAVDNYLRSLNYPVIDSDEIVHKLLDKPLVIKKITNLFGQNIINEDGFINRKALGELIFNYQPLKTKLENYLHPLVKKEILNELDKLATNPLIFIDIPLLYEAHFDDLVDQVLVVSTDEKTQITRLIARDNIDEAYATTKIKSQMPISEKCKLANDIIDNSQELCYTYQKIDKIIKNLKSLVKERGVNYGNRIIL